MPRSYDSGLADYIPYFEVCLYLWWVLSGIWKGKKLMASPSYSQLHRPYIRKRPRMLRFARNFKRGRPNTTRHVKLWPAKRLRQQCIYIAAGSESSMKIGPCRESWQPCNPVRNWLPFFENLALAFSLSTSEFMAVCDKAMDTTQWALCIVSTPVTRFHFILSFFFPRHDVDATAWALLQILLPLERSRHANSSSTSLQEDGIWRATFTYSWVFSQSGWVSCSENSKVHPREKRIDLYVRSCVCRDWNLCMPLWSHRNGVGKKSS